MTLMHAVYSGISAVGKLRFHCARIAAVCAVALLLQAGTFAYTLVLRSGRSVEIPALFVVTRSALIYEVASGLSVSVQISGIDIAATERANHEASGSLLRRIGQNISSPKHSSDIASTAVVTSTHARRQLTNKDLEGLRRAREASDEKYEQQRGQSGFPSHEELRRRREDESIHAREQLHLSEADDAQAEAYWRGRAAALRNEIAVLDSQINYVQSLLAQSSRTSVFAPPVVFGAPGFPLTSYPYGYAYGTGHSSSVITGGTNVFGANVGAQVIGSISIGSRGARVGVGINTQYPPPFSAGNLQRRVIVAPGATWPPVIVASPSYPYYPYDQSYGSNALITRLSELEEARTGLYTRWRILEEEARRAGAFPGWLRP